MMTELVLLIVFGYLIGSVPSAYLAGKWFCGIDIRDQGSGNVGVSNLIRATSWRVGLPAIVFDIGKGVLPVWIAYRLELGVAAQAAVGIATIIGHNWPIFLRFSGGRGVLTTISLLFILPLINGFIPWETVAFFTLAAIGFFALHNVPIGTAAGIAVSPLVSWIMGRPPGLTAGFLAIVLIMIARRLIVPRSAEAANISTKQLIVNRLFLDRDIRDGEAWINRRSTKQISATKAAKEIRPSREESRERDAEWRRDHD